MRSLTKPILAIAVALGLPAAALAETPLERGTYLVHSVVACGSCHTPLGDKGGPAPGMELAGRLVLDSPEFTAYAPNITPDKETGIGNWTDEQIVTAIREGKRPDGTIIGPPMPIHLYRGMADDDVHAIVAYLRQVPAVKNVVPKSTYHIPLPPSYGPPVGHVTAPAPGPTAEYGAYLAGPLGHCIECHTPQVKGRSDFEHQLGAGGFKFPGPWGVSVSADITPHEDGIKDLSDADLVKIITTGVWPTGEAMMPPMPYAYYANIREDDLKAIIAYLRSLPPKPFPEEQ